MIPSTIKHPAAFARSPSAGFDGVFDWSWTQGCFGETKISPMDFDGVVERKNNFIIFETKNIGVPVQDGQLRTLRAQHARGDSTIVIIHGKLEPEEIEVWFPPQVTDKPRTYKGIDAAKKIVRCWYVWANKNPRQRIDYTLLQRRVVSLIEEKDALQLRIERAAALAEQLLNTLVQK